jgi:hypothetical protein
MKKSFKKLKLFRVLLISTFCFHSLVAFCMAQQSIESYGDNQMIIKFNELNERSHWRVTNDSVMGGVSSGSMLIEDNVGLFTGDISLDYNGGFTSTYRRIDNLASNVEKISIKVKGDGQTYQLRLIANVDGYPLAYKHEFVTSSETQEQLDFKLADFTATFRGRSLINAPKLLAEKIQEIGFLMTKKTPGQFTLTIIDIEFN